MSRSGGETLGGLAAGKYDLAQEYAGIGAGLSAASVERKLGQQAVEAASRAKEYAGTTQGLASGITGLISAASSLGVAGIKAGQAPKASTRGGLDGSWKEYAKPDTSW
jgi:F0F1-type ATP synthase membrane subunit c/vacuolar-type H+-ATPase subunit K